MNKNRKGFTIVELVIVIAVIAILAAVLIPTFASLIAKANVSADTQLVRNLNTALTTEKAGGENNKTMYDALKMVNNAGYDIDTIVSKSGNNIAWDSVNDRFVLIDPDKNTFIYPTEAGANAQGIGENDAVNYFVIYKELPTEQKYSIYLSKNANITEAAVKVGFDAGENENVTAVTYENSDKQDVIIRTNGSTKVVIKDTGDGKQYHYGNAEVVDVTTGNNCYYEYGNTTVLIARAGTINVQNGASVAVVAKNNNVTFNKETNATVAVEKAVAEEANFEELASNAEQYVALVGDEGYKSIEEAITAATDGDTIKLIKDIESSTTINVDVSNCALTIDGNGHKLTTNVETTSIMTVNGSKEFTLKNLAVYANKVIKDSIHADIFINTTGKVVVDGCIFDGIANAYYNVIEFGGNTVVADGTTFSNNVFNGESMRHNCINMYTEAANATIYVVGNSFINLGTSATNAIRISDYTDAVVNFEFKDNIYTYIAQAATTKYAGFVLIQTNKGGCKNVTLNFKNLTVMDNVALDNNSNTHNQVYYVYTVNNMCTFDGPTVNFEK